MRLFDPVEDDPAKGWFILSDFKDPALKIGSCEHSKNDPTTHAYVILKKKTVGKRTCSIFIRHLT